jgi:hypothetical protein
MQMSDRPLKIMMVFSFPVRTGGGFKSALAMVKQLQLAGHSVIVLAPSGLDKIIEELKTTDISERSGRSQDKEDDYMMQKLRSLGYM